MASAQTNRDEQLRSAVEISVRVGLIALLVLWCFQIVRPFLQPIIWGAILAVATRAPHKKLAAALGGRPALAAAVLAGLALLFLLGPAIALSASLVDTASTFAHQVREGSIKVPVPPAAVADWPVVGERLYAYWKLASENLETALTKVAPQLRSVGVWLVAQGASAGVGVLMFAISIVIGGAMLANASRTAAAAEGIAIRLAGPRGRELTELAGRTVMSVTRGILGVAVIQSLLAGLGFLAVGVPAAGLWTLLVLALAILQLPTFLILLPIAVYVFSVSATWVAILFAGWSALVGLIDNVLKPLLMGRGVDVPMLVIFLGAIGGFLLDGFVGLFVGAVVLAVGYSLFASWLVARVEA